MKNREELKLNRLHDKFRGIQLYLSQQKDKDIQVDFSYELDVGNQSLYLGSIGISYTVNTKRGETLDYLTVNELKDVTKGIPVTFKGYDSSVEHGWDYYNDELRDGEFIQEYWEDEADLSESLSVNLEIEDVEELTNYLTDKKLPTIFYIEGLITKEKTSVNIDNKYILSETTPYLENKDVVKVLKNLLSMDKDSTEDVGNIVLKQKANKVDFGVINNEFLQNIQVLLTHEKFKKLIHGHTVEECDNGYLYIDTYSKTATLTRYFSGAYYHVNTVYDLPLTLSTKYQVEDIGDLISTATPEWESGTLNGKYSRVLHADEDYTKFANFVRNHFPSLLSKKGVLKQIKMSIRLGDVKPNRISHTPGFSSYTVVGDDNTGLETKTNRILSVVSVIGGSRDEVNSTDADTFYEEYRTFLGWLAKNLK